MSPAATSAVAAWTSAGWDARSTAPVGTGRPTRPRSAAWRRRRPRGSQIAPDAVQRAVHHLEPRAVRADEPPVDRRRQGRAPTGVREHRQRRIERQGRVERAEPEEAAALGLPEPGERELDGRLEGPVAGDRVGERSAERARLGRELLADPRQGQGARPHRREADGERQAVELVEEPFERVGIDVDCPPAAARRARNSARASSRPSGSRARWTASPSATEPWLAATIRIRGAARRHPARAARPSAVT